MILALAMWCFAAVTEGRKTFEIRKNDRDFHVRDTLVLREWDGGYSGKEELFDVIYMTDYAQKDNYVVLGIEVVRFYGDDEFF